jgi:hypothetical protein
LAPQQQPDFGGIYLEIKSNIGGAQETHMSSSVKPKPWITIEAVTKKNLTFLVLDCPPDSGKK